MASPRSRSRDSRRLEGSWKRLRAGATLGASCFSSGVKGSGFSSTWSVLWVSEVGDSVEIMVKSPCASVVAIIFFCGGNSEEGKRRWSEGGKEVKEGKGGDETKEKKRKKKMDGRRKKEGYGQEGAYLCRIGLRCTDVAVGMEMGGMGGMGKGWCASHRIVSITWMAVDCNSVRFVLFKRPFSAQDGVPWTSTQ